MKKSITIQVSLDRDLGIDVELDYQPSESPTYWGSNPSPGQDAFWDVFDAKATFRTKLGWQEQDVTLLAQAGFFDDAIQDALEESLRLDAINRAEARIDALREERYLSGVAE